MDKLSLIASGYADNLSRSTNADDIKDNFSFFITNLQSVANSSDTLRSRIDGITKFADENTQKLDSFFLHANKKSPGVIATNKAINEGCKLTDILSAVTQDDADGFKKADNELNKKIAAIKHRLSKHIEGDGSGNDNIFTEDKIQGEIKRFFNRF
ncbi:hypothetical protein [Biostraticola tofi]|uniref:Uncharacterized protein n=1 Tax=Biostraticola tofi TaxID=466109 RepID=A0A4R3Z5T4_9GAMM|nr:hypothetical protein [Biostraticola tofi]TCW00449.1 hypothetical protein EDC52_101799 [Biostraticola tofi]